MSWEGRFQPIQRGHVAYVTLLLGCARHLWSFVVENVDRVRVRVS